MANEATVQLNASANKNGVKADYSQSFSLNITGDKIYSTVQNIGLIVEDIALWEGGIPQVLILCNLDTTNFINIVLDGDAILQLLPGGPAQVVSLTQSITTIEAQADTAPCNLQITAIGS